MIRIPEHLLEVYAGASVDVCTVRGWVRLVKGAKREKAQFLDKVTCSVLAAVMPPLHVFVQRWKNTDETDGRMFYNFSALCSQTLTSPRATDQVSHHTKTLNNTTVSCI